jgi:two-component system nitrogen regulation response regulator NtrX
MNKNVTDFSPAARQKLLSQRWPGNVRELRNVVERLVIMVPGDAISADDLAFLGHPGGLPSAEETELPVGRLTLHEARERFERDLILRTLAEQQGNMSRTAEVLGVVRSNLYRKMRGFGIPPARRAEAEEESA